MTWYSAKRERLECCRLSGRNYQIRRCIWRDAVECQAAGRADLPQASCDGNGSDGIGGLILSGCRHTSPTEQRSNCRCVVDCDGRARNHPCRQACKDCIRCRARIGGRHCFQRCDLSCSFLSGQCRRVCSAEWVVLRQVDALLRNVQPEGVGYQIDASLASSEAVLSITA